MSYPYDIEIKFDSESSSEGRFLINLGNGGTKIYCTLSFTNTEYPQFSVALPSDITKEEGSTIILPSISGTFEEGEYDYSPSGWDVGEFNISYTITENTVTNLQWNRVLVEYTVSFENSSKPQFDVPLPEDHKVARGSSLTLPTVSDSYMEGSIRWTPSEWDIGEFNTPYTPTNNTVAELQWISEDLSFPYAGNFTLEEETSSSLVDGGDGYLPLSKHNKDIINLIGWDDGDIIPKVYNEKFFFSVVGNEEGGDLNIAYFTSDGKEEVSNTTLSISSEYPLYDESGNVVRYFTESDYTIINAVRLGHNPVWSTGDVNSLSVNKNDSDPSDEYLSVETGSTLPLNSTIHSIMYKEKLSPITIDLKLKSDGSSVTFSTNDYWYSYFRSSSDQSKAEKYGLAINDNQLDADNLNTYNITIMALLDSSGNEVEADLSNFWVGTGNGKVRIQNSTAFTTSVAYWRVYIESY